MNTGVISKRYAKALLGYVQETGGGERVSAQVRQLLGNADMSGITLEPELRKFMELLVQKGRVDYVRGIFHTFLDLYCDSIGVKRASLTVAAPAPGLEDRLRPLLEEQFGCKVVIDTKVDPDLVGGFVVEVGGYVLDSSVRHRIDILRRQFIISNNRIV